MENAYKTKKTCVQYIFFKYVTNLCIMVILHRVWNVLFRTSWYGTK